MKTMDVKLEKLIQSLRNKGLKLTPQRMVIFNILSGSEKHFTADEVYQEAKKIYTMLSATTVYRNLEEMVGAGLLSHFRYSGSAMRYDTNIEQHHHFICTRCGGVKDIYLKTIDYDVDTEKFALDRFRIDGSELYLNGVCEGCLEDSDNDKGT
ncbi:MAG TPA: transcriptional repressor [Thermodesulfobacteriota bacterium]|nr:transcriptional repressor [Thermodesulfobacteriota bacterium]